MGDYLGLGKGARGKTLIYVILGAILGALSSHIPKEALVFVFNNFESILFTFSGVIASAYTIYQEYREFKRHGSLHHNQKKETEVQK